MPEPSGTLAIHLITGAVSPKVDLSHSLSGDRNNGPIELLIFLNPAPSVDCQGPGPGPTPEPPTPEELCLTAPPLAGCWSPHDPAASRASTIALESPPPTAGAWAPTMDGTEARVGLIAEDTQP